MDWDWVVFKWDWVVPDLSASPFSEQVSEQFSVAPFSFQEQIVVLHVLRNCCGLGYGFGSERSALVSFEAVQNTLVLTLVTRKPRKNAHSSFAHNLYAKVLTRGKCFAAKSLSLLEMVMSFSRRLALALVH
jgi:hypothetical protein